MTAFAELIADDYLIFDDVQTVTLGKPDGTTDSVGYVSSGPVNFKAMQLIGGGLGVGDETTSFSLPASLCAFAPLVGYTIGDEEGVIWRILLVDCKTSGTRYSCACVRDKAEISAPLQPANFAVSDGGNGILLAAWNNPNWRASTTYELEYSTSSSFATKTTESAATTSAEPVVQVDTGGTGTLLYVRVRQRNSLGKSPYSEVASITLQAAQAAPTTLVRRILAMGVN